MIFSEEYVDVEVNKNNQIASRKEPYYNFEVDNAQHETSSNLSNTKKRLISTVNFKNIN